MKEQKVKALFYEKISNKTDFTLRCRLCPHNCIIKNGEFGICKVRKNIEGTLFSKSYGIISALALDPIEKKPLYHFYPHSTILSIGSLGCNMSCLFCQNHSISQSGIDSLRFVHADYIEPEQLADLALSMKDKKNIGVAFTYNEPFTNFEYMLETAKIVRTYGLKNVVVSNGYISLEALDLIMPYIDAINIDIKAFTNTFYTSLCSAGLEPVKQSIERIIRHYKHCHVELTTLVIPEHNDSVKEMEELSTWIALLSPEIPFHINRHHPAWKMKEPGPIKKDALYALAEKARSVLKHVYVGNI